MKNRDEKEWFLSDIVTVTRAIKFFVDKQELEDRCLAELRFNFDSEHGKHAFAAKIIEVTQQFHPVAFPGIPQKDQFGNFVFQFYGIKIILVKRQNGD